MIRQEIDTIFQTHGQGKYEGSHPSWRAFVAWIEEIKESDALRLAPGTKVDFSVGVGNWARVPWLALMDPRETNTIRRGVYIVYLFRGDLSGVYLTLAQGVTILKEERGRRDAWRELKSRAATIRPLLSDLTALGFSLEDDIDLRAGEGLGRDYEQSTIAHKFYPKEAIPDDADLLADLAALLSAYDDLLSNQPSELRTISEPRTPQPRNNMTPANGHQLTTAFLRDATDESVGLRLDSSLAVRFLAALSSKPFLILTGLAGSGKTKVAQAFAQWLCVADSQYQVVPVGADWVGNENILGYPDGLDPTRYVTMPTLALLQHAAKYPDDPHFLILDEMNLSHVERYFADLLSAIESGEPVLLYQADRTADGNLLLRSDVPESISLPPNLFTIGTVNVDETTYMFSPKVLDRANVIEFRMHADDLAAFLGNPRATNVSKLGGSGQTYAPSFVTSSKAGVSVPVEVRERYSAELLLFFNLLRRHNAEFGYRVGHEAGRFMAFYKLWGGYGDDAEWFDSAMDAVIAQKLLPKLHGSRSKLEGLLWALIWATGASREVRGETAFDEQLRQASAAQDEINFGPDTLWSELEMRSPLNPSGAARYPLSHDKLMRMWRKLVQDQFVTFAEA